LFPLAGGVLAVFLALPSASLHRTVQQHVNRVLYGCHYDFSTVTSSFSIRLAQTLGQEGLTGLLVRDLTEQMAIQQAALFLSEGNRLVIQRPEVENISVALDDELCRVLLDARVPVRAMHLQGLLSPAALADWRRFDWARLFVPLIFENQLDGLLILGDRTAGDVYSDQDVQIIATIAYQGALAYANVRLVEMLRGLHHQLVRADEAGRKQIARDLHDTVLQQLFFIKQGLFSEHAHTPLIDHIDDVIQTLRQTIRAQRPALLDQGLQFALQDLVEEMQALASPAEISWHSTGTGRLALSDEQTTALYRIAQEALTNSVKHASARTIKVSLQVRPDGSCRLCIEDDGVGMHTSGRGTRSPGHHYGLVGMRERAAMINAKLHISSAPGEGTRIAVEAC
ncbi:MAG: hypothetical protein JXA14_00485, partial [Anaerolineae bacterium]|nr:hypothetical protein [Anaerolineae bacterium]